MKTFLAYTAEDLYNKHKDHLHRVAVVFPNNRARIFFIEYLYNAAGKPIWTPQFININQLFTRHSDLMIADPILLNSILYKVYQQHTHDNESFDEFFGWGNMLLNDFDNVDKNCVDARQLFRNIKEQEEYADKFEHLTPEQIDVIKKFFSHFKGDRTERSELKQQFLRIWNHLYDIYTGFRTELQTQKIAYEGMLNRSVVEDFDRNGLSVFDADCYAFVGFNALNVCEEKLFKRLHDAGKAVFYWDYDNYYLNHPQHEAGLFLRNNLAQFPNELKDPSCFLQFQETSKQVNFIASPTENAQAHYAGKWLKESAAKYKPEETAVVLCNEHLLLPVLHCIPDEIKDLNITMGYPMTQTPVFNLVRQLILLHTDGRRAKTFRTKFALPLLQNNYIRQISPKAAVLEKDVVENKRFSISIEQLRELFETGERDTALETIFQVVEQPADLGKLLMAVIRLLANENNDETLRAYAQTAKSETDTANTETATADSDTATAAGEEESVSDIFLPLYQESLFQAYTTLSRLNDLLNKGLFEINRQTYRKLALKVLNVAIPFSGEPLRGVQIMGVLETRNLDFKNVLLLSTNEGILPKGSSDSSFIPYNLRRAFQLTGPEHQDAISAYYFFRLLQRAENISLVYNNLANGLNSGEMSRFMRQLEIASQLQNDPQIHLRQSVLTADVNPLENEAIVTPKDRAILDKIPRRLSPSGINTYIACPLRYYYRYIVQLKKEEAVSEDIDGATFGNIFHHASEYLYTGLLLKKNHLPAGHEDILRVIDANNSRQQDIAGNVIRQASLNELLKKDDFTGLVVLSDLETIKDKDLETIVDFYLREDYFRLTGTAAANQYNGTQLIQRSSLIRFLKDLLLIDKQKAPFEIRGLEMKIEECPHWDNPSGITINGRIDRLDLKGSTLHIIDYKTGGKPFVPKNSDALFQSGKEHTDYILQACLYAGVIRRSLLAGGFPADLHVKPELLYIHLSHKEDFRPDIAIGKEIIEDIRPYEDDLQKKLQTCLASLYQADIPFSQTEVPEVCIYCDFKGICGRG